MAAILYLLVRRWLTVVLSCAYVYVLFNRPNRRKKKREKRIARETKPIITSSGTLFVFIRCGLPHSLSYSLHSLSLGFFEGKKALAGWLPLLEQSLLPPPLPPPSQQSPLLAAHTHTHSHTQTVFITPLKFWLHIWEFLLEFLHSFILCPFCVCSLRCLAFSPANTSGGGYCRRSTHRVS